MTKIVINNGSYRGQEINGEFDLVNEFKISERSGNKDGVVRVILNGKPVNVCVDYADLHKDAPVEESYEDILDRISKRFNILERMTAGVINGSIRSLIVAGAPGVGKTYTVERMLKAADSDGDISFTHIKGYMTARGLYKKLYDCSSKGSVMAIDDCDAIFGDDIAMNLLKGALDTSEERWISWGAESRGGDDEVPQTFKFEGTVVFISNVNFQAVIDNGGRMAPHMDALISRSIYLDLALHDRRAIMARVEDLSLNTPMLFSKGLDRPEVETTINWLKDNISNLRELSLRTALKLAQFVKADSDWQDIAEVTLLKQ